MLNRCAALAPALHAPVGIRLACGRRGRDLLRRSDRARAIVVAALRDRRCCAAGRAFQQHDGCDRVGGERQPAGVALRPARQGGSRRRIPREISSRNRLQHVHRHGRRRNRIQSRRVGRRVRPVRQRRCRLSVPADLLGVSRVRRRHLSNQPDEDVRLVRHVTLAVSIPVDRT